VENSKRLGLTISFMRMLKWWAFPNTQLPSEESRCVWQRYLIKKNRWGGSRATCVQVWMAEQKMDWYILEHVLYVHVRIGIKWHPKMMQIQPEVPWDKGEKTCANLAELNQRHDFVMSLLFRNFSRGGKMSKKIASSKNGCL
jgi:hypothetical protein